jgi:hypothetical protein
MHVPLYWSRCTLSMRLDYTLGYGTRRTESAAILTANATGYVERTNTTPKPAHAHRMPRELFVSEP